MSQLTSWWRRNGAHALLYVTSGLALVAQYAPAAVPGHGLAIAAGATALLGIIHQVSGPSVTAKPPSTVAKILAVLFVGTLLAVGLQGCKTLPTTQQQGLITAAVDVATGAAIQHGTTDQAVWKARAAKFKAIAVQLQTVNEAGPMTLATLAADLQPQIAKLGPSDALAANALVAAVTPYIQQQIQTNPSLGNAQAVVGMFLQAVIDACSVYGG